ncbi:MAG: hypothetical protein ACI970_001623 [Myxococcota bacterium]
MAYGRSGAGYAAAPAAPFHFEPTQLGQFLLLDTEGDLLAAEKGAVEQAGDAVQQAEFYSPVDRDTHLTRSLDDDVPAPLTDHSINGNAPAVDSHTGAIVAGPADRSADWRSRKNVDGTFTFILDAAAGRVLSIADGSFVLADAAPAGDAARFHLVMTDEEGCAVWPEVEINVEGPVLAGATPWDETRGTIDAHLHLMAFEFLGGELRCGRPWHPYGVTEAMGDCPENSMTGAKSAEAVVGSGPEDQSELDDQLWPSFTVPKNNTLTYEQTYHRWVERAWRGGLRMMTVLAVDNNVLCEAYPYKRNSCNEMDSVRLQVQRLNEFVDFLDARAGGPGEGFAQIATTPFEAREIINQGRLALTIGIEVSVLFDCGESLGVSRCTNADITRQLDELQAIGVVQMEIVNKFDNALSGVTGDGGTTGIIVNQGNRQETGHFWNMETCPAAADRTYGSDKTQMSAAQMGDGTPFEGPVRDPLAAQIFTATGYVAGGPLYPVGPHCNTVGLLDQGEFLLQEMAARGMLFDPDHMSARAADRALDVMQELGYAGIVSSHSWAQSNIYERIYGLGGMVTPYAGSSGGFVGAWRQRVGWSDDRYYFGMGYGADTNGLGGQGGPRNPAEGQPRVEYPFEVPGGAMVDMQVSGDREPYDFNTTGTAHYGLYVDWIEDLRVQAGDEIMQDMLRGPEAYLQVWERAVGVPTDACIFAPGTNPTQNVTSGMTFDEVLLAAGQPHTRTAEGYTYCGVDADGAMTEVLVVFTDGGTVGDTVETIARTAPAPLNPIRVEAAALAVDTERTDAPTHAHDEDEVGVEVGSDTGAGTDGSHQHDDGTTHLHAAGLVGASDAPAGPSGQALVSWMFLLLAMSVVRSRVRKG